MAEEIVSQEESVVEPQAQAEQDVPEQVIEQVTETEMEQPEQEPTDGKPKPSKSSKLYNSLLNEGYTVKNLGLEEEFNKRISDPVKAGKIYDALIADGYTPQNLRGSKESFVSFYKPELPQQPIKPIPQKKEFDFEKTINSGLFNTKSDATRVVKPITEQAIKQVEQSRATKDVAIDNTVDRRLKNKGVKAAKNSPLYQSEKKKVQQAIDDGDAIVSKNPITGEPVLAQTTGFWESLWNSGKEAVRNEEEADEFVNKMTTEQRVEYANRKAEARISPEGYVGEVPTEFAGATGQLVGGVAPFMAKATLGGLTGAALVAAAPVTGGASLAGIPALLAATATATGGFAATVGDMVNQGGRDEVIRRYQLLKERNPQLPDIEAMKEAEKGLLAGEIAGGITNMAFMGAGGALTEGIGKKMLSNESKNVIGKYMKSTLKSASKLPKTYVGEAVKSGVKMGAIISTTEAGKEIGAGLGDSKLKLSREQIIDNLANSFVENAKVGTILHALSTSPRLPGIIKSTFKGALSKENPAELAQTLRNNEVIGNIPQGSTERVMADILEFNDALGKTSEGLTPDTQVSVAGLIQKRDRLMNEMASKDPTQVEAYKQQIDALDEQIKKITESNDPFAHEVNVVGEKLSEVEKETEPQLPQVKEGEKVYRVEYTDPQTGQKTSKLFANAEEGKKFQDFITDPKNEWNAPRDTNAYYEKYDGSSKLEGQVEAIEQTEVIRQMKPITDKMAEVEREFENNDLSIDTDYDNEIIITNKRGEIVDVEDVPDNLIQLATDYENATRRLGEFDSSAREKALAESRKIEEVVAEEVKPSELPQAEEKPSVGVGGDVEATAKALGENKTKNELNTPLSKSQFDKKYVAQHKDLIGKRESKWEANKNSILQNGLRKGVNVNALPISEGGEPRNVIDRKYGNKKGDIIYILPEEGIIEGRNGYITKEGYIPKNTDIVVIEYDKQSTYEAYKNQYSKNIAEAYHKAKADGSNPELVKAVEQSLKETTAETKNQFVELPEIKKVKDIIKQVKGRVGILSGDANAETRRFIIETLTGEKTSKSNAGVNRLMQVVEDYIGLKPDSQAGKYDQINKWANEPTKPIREEVSGAVQPTPEVPKEQKAETRVQPSAERVSDGKAETTASVLEQEQTRETDLLLSGEAEKRRKEGKFVKDGIEFKRNEKGGGVASEKGGEVRFTSEPGGGGVVVPFKYKLVEAETLQPSHQDGIRNPLHFIPEAQPKNRNDIGTLQAEESFANNPRFNELGENTGAYGGAPVVNERGEVIQGNNRSAGLRKGYQRGNKSYKQSLSENAEQFGFSKEQVDGMKEPVLVREVKTSDQGAIELGNYDVKDLETGGKRRLDPVAITRRMPFNTKGRIADILFKGEETLNQAIRSNIKRLMEYLDPYLNQSQRNTIFKNNELTDAGIKDLELVVQQFLFDGGDVALPELYENLSHTQKEGLRKALPYIFSTSAEKSITPEIQEAILALNDFGASKAGSFEGWLSQSDMFNNGLTPREKYSPTAIKIAEILETSKSQKEISSQFGKYAENVNDRPATMFEEAVKGGSKKEGIKEVFKTEYDESKKPEVSPRSTEEALAKEEPKPEPISEKPSRVEPKPAEPIKLAEPAERELPAEQPKKPRAKKEPGKFEQEATKIADKIKATELPKWLQTLDKDITKRGGGLSPEQLRDMLADAVVTMGKLMDKGVEFSQAVKVAVKQLIKAQGEENRDAIEKGFSEYYRENVGEKPPTERLPEMKIGEGELRGIRMEDNAERRAEIGMPERQANPESVEQWRAKAQEEISKGYNVNKLIDKMDKGDMLSPVENEISRIFAATLDSEVKRNPSNENINAYKRFIQAREKASAKIGQSLRSLQGVSNPLENISDFFVAKMESLKVDELTESQIAETKKDFENIQTAKEEYRKKYEEAETKLAEIKAQNELLRQKKEKIQGKVYTTEGKRDFKAERENLKQKLRDAVQKYKNNANKLGLSSDGGAENFAISVDMAKIISGIAKSHVEEVGAKLVEVTKRTLDDVKDIFDGITEKDIRDVIAGKYSERKETKSELQANINQIRSEAKLLNELDRVLAREPKTEQQRIEKNQELASLRRQINEVKKKGGLDEYSEEARIERATKAAEENIKDLEEKLSKNELDVQKAEKLKSPELDSLREKQKQLRNELEAKRKEAGLGKYSEEARIKKAIEANKRKEQELKERLDKGDFEPQEKRQSVYESPEFKRKYPQLYKELLDSRIAKEKAELEFNRKLIEEEMKSMSKVDKFKQVLLKARGTLKAFFAGIDDSAVGVQNWMQSVRNPVIGAKAMKNHIIDFWSEKAFERRLAELHESPDYYIMRDSGLSIYEPESLLEKAKDEFFPTRFKAIIKLNGKEYGWLNMGGKKYELFDVLKPFERAFTSLGNSLRVIKFRTETEKMYEKGLTFEKNPEQFKALATRINAMTSASDPSKAFKSDIVNLAVWSPRLMASKLNILFISDLASFTPLVEKGYYRSLGEKGKVLSRQQLYAAADLAKFATSIVAGSYLFASARGGKLNTNPYDDDFMDIELPNGKSYNFTGGFSKYVATLFQLISGGEVSKLTGKYQKYSGFKDRGAEALHFMRGKMPPVSGAVVNLAVGKDYTGKETSLSSEAERFKMPMAISQISKQIDKDGYSVLYGDAIPTFMGITVKDSRDYSKPKALFEESEFNSPEMKILLEKDIVPAIRKKEQYKVQVDIKHPDGLMTDEEFDIFVELTKKYMKEGFYTYSKRGNLIQHKSIKDILGTDYAVQKMENGYIVGESAVKGKDLDKEKLSNKINDLKEESMKKAKLDMGFEEEEKIIVKEYK